MKTNFWSFRPPFCVTVHHDESDLRNAYNNAFRVEIWENTGECWPAILAQEVWECRQSALHGLLPGLLVILGVFVYGMQLLGPHSTLIALSTWAVAAVLVFTAMKPADRQCMGHAIESAAARRVRNLDQAGFEQYESDEAFVVSKFYDYLLTWEEALTRMKSMREKAAKVVEKDWPRIQKSMGKF